MLHNATVTFDTSVISTASLVEKIRDTGYGAELPALDQSILDEQEKHDEDQLLEYQQLRTKAGVSLVAGTVAMILSMPLMSMTSVGGMERMKDPLMSWSMRVLDPALHRALPWMYSISSDAIRWFLFALSAVIIAWAGRRFYVKAWSALLHKTADMNTLVALGTGTAFLYSAATTIAPGKGLLQDASGNAIAINGLWDISPANNSAAGSYDPAGAPGSELYFTAGPNKGTGGLFGYLKPAATDLTEGNDQ